MASKAISWSIIYDEVAVEEQVLRSIKQKVKKMIADALPNLDATKLQSKYEYYRTLATKGKFVRKVSEVIGMLDPFLITRYPHCHVLLNLNKNKQDEVLRLLENVRPPAPIEEIDDSSQGTQQSPPLLENLGPSQIDSQDL